MNLLIVEEVFVDLESAAKYYENLQLNLGLRILQDWEETLAAVIKNPLGFQKKI